MSQSATSRTAISSAASHGKIKTENPELLTLLRDKTGDDQNFALNRQASQHITSRLDNHLASAGQRSLHSALKGGRSVDQNNQNLHGDSTPVVSARSGSAFTKPVGVVSTPENLGDSDDDEARRSTVNFTDQYPVPSLDIKSHPGTNRDSYSLAKSVDIDTSDNEPDSDNINTATSEQNNRFLHDLISKSSKQNTPDIDSHRQVLHDKDTRRSSAKSVTSPTARSSVTPAAQFVAGEGQYNSQREVVDNNPGNTTERKSKSPVVKENHSVDPLASVNASNDYSVTDTGTAPVTGRNTYRVPSPVSDHIPNIDSLSNFSHREERPSRKGSSLSISSIPQPRQGNVTPCQSSHLQSARDPSATQRSSSSVYAVANPAILAAQGITPAPNQHHVQFTPRTKPGSGKEGVTDSQENFISNNEAEESHLRNSEEIQEEKKSAVSFTEPKEKRSHFPENDPYTAADSPAPPSEPDWGSPRVKDRVSTPHPHSPSKLSASPVRNDQKGVVVIESDRDTENKAQELSVQKRLFDRYQTPINNLSPEPIGLGDREIQSAVVPASFSLPAEKPVRTNSLPTVKRVYVDSPTFTKDEEEEYRFVESRLGEIQDDVEDTLRRLDEETEKQKKIRKRLEEQMASMYAPAYEEQPNRGIDAGGYSQGYVNIDRDRGSYNQGRSRGVEGYSSRRESYGGDPRREMGSHGNLRSNGEQRRSNMGSHVNLRNEGNGDQRRDNMGSYASLRNDNAVPRRDNMGSYASLRYDNGEPRRDNMGSYATLRNDTGGQRRDNMGSYAGLRMEDDSRSFGEQRRDNMGSYGNVRNDDRAFNGDPRQENLGSYANLRQENERDPYFEQRRDDMGSYPNVRKDSVRDRYGHQDSEPNGYNDQYRRNDNDQDERRSNHRTPYADQNDRRNYDNENRDYGEMRRGSERYEDRDREMNRFADQEKNAPNNDRNRYEDRDMRTEADRYEPVPHHVLNGNFESHDDELRRETEYQEGLKSRIHESGQRDQDIDIPKIPIQSETFRDSLEEEGYGDWKNPPPNPYVQESEREAPKEYEEVEVPEIVNKNDVSKMEVVNPREPTYDFVENNKIDYGKPPERTYRDIKHIQDEESKKLEKIFIQPKVPPKKKPTVSKTGLKSAPSKFQLQSPVEEFDPDSPAETLWAKRSAALKKKDKTTFSGTSKRPKGLQKYPSESKLVRPSAQQGSNIRFVPNDAPMYGTPTRNHFLEPMDHKPAAAPQQYVSPVDHASNYNGERQSPSYRRPLNLKPITQEIVTEDGQRISLDINLKVVSPPPGADNNSYPLVTADVAPKPQGNRGNRPTGLQYQMGGYEEQEELPQPFQAVDHSPLYSEPQQSQHFGKFSDYPYYPQNNYNYPQYNYNYDPHYRQPQPQQYEGYGNQENIPPHQITYPTHSQPIEANPELSPYPKVPPISLTDEETYRKEYDESGYAAMYKRSKEKPQQVKPWYQIYTLKDYRKMQEELKVTVGTLGPDLDNKTHKEKLENRHKQLEYAGLVMEKNKRELEGKKPVQVQSKKEEEHSKRKAALEYSRNVPKPTVRMKPNQYNSYDVAAQMAQGGKQNKSPTQTLDVIDLQKLQQRHEQEKQNVASIRQNVESVPQKA